MPEQKQCDHPEDKQFCAHDGAAQTIYWCESCGAILFANEDNEEWWVPGGPRPSGVQEN